MTNDEILKNKRKSLYLTIQMNLRSKDMLEKLKGEKLTIFRHDDFVKRKEYCYLESK